MRNYKSLEGAIHKQFLQSIKNTRTKQSCVSWAPALEGPGAERRDTLPNIR